MQKSPIQQYGFSKDGHQDSNKFIHGGFLIAPHAKYSGTYFIKHSVRFREIVNLWRNNINFVIVILLMIQRCISVLSGLCSNKMLQPTQQYAVSLRYTLYCRSAELKR